MRNVKKLKTGNVGKIISLLSVLTVFPLTVGHAEIPNEGSLLPDNVVRCGLNLLEAVGKSSESEAVARLPQLYREASISQEEEFMEYLLSVIYVESRFDRKAISPKEARGLMQMTLPAVQDAARSCSLKPLGDMNRLHDSHTNVKYGSCYLKKLHMEMDRDWRRTLIAYNGGYAQLIKYDKGQPIASETANYVLQVERILSSVCRANTSPTIQQKEIK